MRRVDVLHLGLMLLALAIAYVLPFELFLLSYAILGPAHYFTEISWLHDRGYYLPHRAVALVLVAIAFGAMFIADPYWTGLLLWSVFLTVAILASVSTVRSAIAYGLASTALTLCLLVAGAPFGLLGTLLPTLIHVCVFTLIFMTNGVIRARSVAQFAMVCVYVGAVAVIVTVPPWAGAHIPVFARVGRENFGNVAPALGALVGVPDLRFDGRITGLLSLVYTYHYLNWFIKADVINWAAIPRARMLAIVALSSASTALYFYNYDIGILVLVVVSMIHVLLEFPLNSISFRQMGKNMHLRTTS